MVAENRDKKGKGIFIITIILVLMFVLGFWLVGYQGVMQVVKWVLIFAIILAIIGGVFYFVWFFFFKKQKFDVTYVNKLKLLDACHKGNNGLLKDLYLSGDKGHSRFRWGKITGYCRISVLMKTFIYDLDDNGEPTDVVKKVKNDMTGRNEDAFSLTREEQDVFSVSHKGFPLNLFEEEDVVRVGIDQHDDLLGNVILFSISLIPISEYWYINDDLLDVRKIDFAILKEAERSILFEQQRDFKEIVDKASGLDSGHQKRIEEKSMYEIPVQK